MLQIYNSLSRQKEPLKTLKPFELGIYVCGITVYDHCHIGHARMFLVFDMVIRVLKTLGYKVTYVRNITDVDDKIIARAKESQQDIQAFTEYYIQSMHEDTEALNLIAPDLEPRATHYIEKMQTLIQTLIDKNLAYEQAGDVYFNVRGFNSYGALSNRDLDDLRIGARIEPNQAKRDPLDFVLWKKVPAAQPHWPSPWGIGRPGWHIECSAMSLDTLGERFDIHGGGPDLKFPHHENERAQSEGASGQTFVSVWMHTGYVQINQEKMSKSLHNFTTIKDFTQKFHPEILRFFILSSHYRSPIDYHTQAIEQARSALMRLYRAVLPYAGLSTALTPPSSALSDSFVQVLEDDFNTPQAISQLFELARELQKARAQSALDKARALAQQLVLSANVLGLLECEPASFLQGMHKQDISVAEIEQAVAARREARCANDWAKADKIRAELEARGVILEDKNNETTWRLV